MATSDWGVRQACSIHATVVIATAVSSRDTSPSRAKPAICHALSAGPVSVVVGASCTLVGSVSLKGAGADGRIGSSAASTDVVAATMVVATGFGVAACAIDGAARRKNKASPANIGARPRRHAGAGRAREPATSVGPGSRDTMSLTVGGQMPYGFAPSKARVHPFARL
ncbi:MAG: hypothetical protein WKF47_10985 [Geodermatophilaceae bacterium]